MKRVHPIILAAIALLFMFARPGAGLAQDHVFPVITGEQWMKSTQQEKLAYVAGMTTIIEVEKEVQAKEPARAGKGLVSSWVEGLSPYKIKDIVSIIDGYYSKQPDRTDRAVVEVMWFEAAAPNIKK